MRRSTSWKKSSSEADADANEADWYVPGWYYQRQVKYSEPVGPFETRGCRSRLGIGGIRVPEETMTSFYAVIGAIGVLIIVGWYIADHRR